MELFNDKAQEFNCKVLIEGASVDNTVPRVLLRFADKTLMYEGTIDRDGNCKVEIPPMKNEDASQGEATLEVIAESTVFEPWKDTFTIKRSKNVTVEGASVSSGNSKKEPAKAKNVIVEMKDVKTEAKKDEPEEDPKLKEVREFVLEMVKEFKSLPESKRKILHEKLKKNVLTKSSKKTITEAVGSCKMDALKYSAYKLNKNRPDLLK